MMVPLQSCSGALDCWSTGAFFEGFVQGLQTNAPIAVFGMLVAVPLYLGLYWWSKNHTLPMTAMVLMGAGLFPLLPAQVVRLMWIAIVFTGATALFAVIWVVIR